MQHIQMMLDIKTSTCGVNRDSGTECANGDWLGGVCIFFE
jgi:hypothetical protein